MSRSAPFPAHSRPTQDSPATLRTVLDLVGQWIATQRLAWTREIAETVRDCLAQDLVVAEVGELHTADVPAAAAGWGPTLTARQLCELHGQGPGRGENVDYGKVKRWVKEGRVGEPVYESANGAMLWDLQKELEHMRRQVGSAARRREATRRRKVAKP